MTRGTSGHAMPQRCLAGIGVLMLTLLFHSSAVAQDLPPAIMLTAAPISLEQNAEKRVPRPAIIHRELARQAFLLAAREECGLRTRDDVLHEPVDRNSLHHFLATVSSHYVTGTVTTITRGSEVIFQGTAKTTGDRTRHYISEVVWQELNSRTGYVDALNKAGYPRVARAAFGDRPVPQSAQQKLREHNFLSQLDAVRQLHQAIREQGESEELLSALARGYAHLMNHTLPTPDYRHVVFQARAWLYAQRLLTLRPESPVAYWTRGYVMAWTGAPNQTEEDFRKATSLGGDLTRAPQWAKLADLSWQYRYRDLRALAEDEKNPERQTAAVLMYRSIRFTHGKEFLVQIGELAAKIAPGCLGVTHEMSVSIRTDDQRTKAAFATHAQLLKTHVPAFHGLEQTVTRLAARISEKPLEIDELGRALVSLGEQDRMEPSLSVVGETVRAWNQTHLLRRVFYLNYLWGTDPRAYVRETEQAFAGSGTQPLYHVYAVHWQRPAEDFAQQPAGEREFAPNYLSDAYLMTAWLPETLTIGGIPRMEHTRRSRAEHGTFEDGHLAAAARMSEEWRLSNLYFLGYHANNSPYHGEMRMGLQWDDVLPEELALWTPQFDQQPGLLWAYARGNKTAGNYAESIAAYEAYLKISPDAEICDGLAEAYFKSGDDGKFLETAERALQYEDFGLAHREIVQHVAATLIQTGRVTQALPWAEHAAQSYSSNGLYYQAECLTLLGDFDGAQDLMRTHDERFGSRAWLHWRVSTGEGDLASALQIALRSTDQSENIQDYPSYPLPEVMALIAMDNMDEAILHLEGTGRGKLLCSLLHDRREATAKRDALWADLAALPADDKKQGGQTTLAKFLQEHASRPETIAAEAVPLQTAELPGVYRSEVDFMLGLFLLNRDCRDDGLTFLKQAACHPTLTAYRALAAHFLRKEGIDPIHLPGRKFFNAFNRHDVEN